MNITIAAALWEPVMRLALLCVYSKSGVFNVNDIDIRNYEVL